jgi:hypothetical protein
MEVLSTKFGGIRDETWANGIRNYTNQVRLRELKAVLTRAGGFSLYSGDFNRQMLEMKLQPNRQSDGRELKNYFGNWLRQ